MNKAFFLLFCMIVCFTKAYGDAVITVEPEKTTNTKINGLNSQALKDYIEVLKKEPKKGKVTYYSDTQWQNGMRSITTFTGYKIDGVMKKEKERHFELVGDEITDIGGADGSPGAVEELMYAVGTCISAAANAKATISGVKLTRIEVVLESDLDLRGILGVTTNVRPGISEFKTKIIISGDADEETLKKIAMWGYNYSPVSDTVRHGVSRSVPPKIEVVK